MQTRVNRLENAVAFLDAKPGLRCVMKNIVALVDFSDLTPKVLDRTAEQAKAFDARAILLHIVPEHGVPADSSFASPVVMAPAAPETIKRDYERLISLRDALTQKDVNVLVEQITEGTVEKVIGECRKWKADLIVVGSHHHSTIYNWFVGSYTADVLKAAFCPVLVVPADEAAV